MPTFVPATPTSTAMVERLTLGVATARGAHVDPARAPVSLVCFDAEPASASTYDPFCFGTVSQA